ncbi:hypothetical protein NC653_036333 [Populus alba x Populus x berolinensis]|uniref:Uncharacterized protein n=1 Tax=Populus alba x Populus x berolinensis TaxID=444605 RepID=A0AAD6LJY4_9ROSI|nr:hypothetical protein NC653_036333 [Populus alba x Populus x berolinensis]
MAAKVLEAIGYGIVVLPTAKRLHLVKVWHPFVSVTEALIDSATTNVEDDPELTIDTELWQSLDPHLFQWSKVANRRLEDTLGSHGRATL